MIARYTGWVDEGSNERKHRYPMMAAAHAVSLIKNGGVNPSDIYVFSDIDINNRYLNFMTTIGVNVIHSPASSGYTKYIKCIEVLKQYPQDIICWVDADMYLFKKINFYDAIENALGNNLILAGDGSIFNARDKILKGTEQWDAQNFIDTWEFSIKDLLDWTEKTNQQWLLGVVYAFRPNILLKYQTQMSINSYDELLIFALSKLINIAKIPCIYGGVSKPNQPAKLTIKNTDCSRWFYKSNPIDANSSSEESYWVHYGGGFKINANTHLDTFCNTVIQEFNNYE